VHPAQQRGVGAAGNGSLGGISVHCFGSDLEIPHHTSPTLRGGAPSRHTQPTVGKASPPLDARRPVPSDAPDGHTCSPQRSLHRADSMSRRAPSAEHARHEREAAGVCFLDKNRREIGESQPKHAPSRARIHSKTPAHLPRTRTGTRPAYASVSCCGRRPSCPARLVIESQWVSTVLALAGQLRPPRHNN
jgi:hypothetical protein